MSFSNSMKEQVSAKHSSVELTSAVASQYEVASFHCHACDAKWLSRVPTVVEQGCGSCAKAKEDLEAEMQQALFGRVAYA